MQIEIGPAIAASLNRPVRGRGGFQSLLRKLQRQLQGTRLEVTEDDIERLVRYSLQYGKGGFQQRTRGAARRSR